MPDRWKLLFSVGLAALLVTAAAGCGGGGGGGKKSEKGTEAGGKGGTLLTLAQAAPSGSPDPQINYTLQEWQLLILTHDGLVGFKRASGTEGTKKVPDLADSIPQPQNGGKTYTFTLRKGIKFSNGKELKASDVKYTFERLFKIKQSPNASTWYNVIVGADKCLKTPATCDLSQGIVVDDAKGTVTFHLTQGDPEFLDKLAVPFGFILPTGTPNKEVNIPPPGTGPYYFKQYAPRKQIQLVRNPNFKEWSKDAQPDGKPDEIIQKFGVSVEGEVTQVENNQADWVFDNPPADRLPELSSSKYADRVHVNALTAVWYFAFNVNQPPFNNLKARQGVNFATDHDALVRIYGGPKLAQPTCQILPPNFPGYKPYCPYTKNPGEKWSAPDLAKAQQLIAASGTKGAKVNVTTDTTAVNKSLALYFVSLLNKLGYKAKLQALSPDIQYPYCQNSNNKIQFCLSSWYQDYPAASDFINILLGCKSYNPGSDASPNIAEFCVKPIEDKIQQALKTGITDANAANDQWAQIDKEIVDQAPWVPMFNPKYIDFLSDRVKGYTFSPQWYFLLGQASVK